MFNILKALKKQIESPTVIKYKRVFAHSPSSSMCYSATNSKPIGSCIRSNYLLAKGYPSSKEKDAYLQMTAEAGKLWEKWLIDQYKILGIYLDHSVRVFDEINNVSGEIDILHMNPETNEMEITECKQYNGSNFYAQSEICGSSSKTPKPKDDHLLQVFLYLLTLKNNEENINFINLVYLDRSCASFYNNMQFRISLYTLADSFTLIPKIEYYDSKGNLTFYLDQRITNNNVYEKNKMLESFIEQDIIPPKDYDMTYTSQKVEMLYKTGEISKTKYNKYKDDPTNNPIGDWRCLYCSFGKNKDGYSVCTTLDYKG